MLLVERCDLPILKTIIIIITRVGFYNPDLHYDFQELCIEADHRLLNKILEYSEQLLPPTLSHRAMILENGLIPDRSQTAVLI